MKKLFIFCLFLVVAVASVGMAFAAEDIGGHNFNIPNGFHEESSNAAPSSLGTQFNKVFKNDKGDIINITVFSCNQNTNFTVHQDSSYQSKSIAGINGFISSNTVTHIPTFSFAENNNQRFVSVAATNENDIESCLK